MRAPSILILNTRVLCHVSDLDEAGGSVDRRGRRQACATAVEEDTHVGRVFDTAAEGGAHEVIIL